MFNAWMGKKALKESEGWMFMCFVKDARAKQGDFHMDDYVDGAAYQALSGQARMREVQEEKDSGT